MTEDDKDQRIAEMDAVDAERQARVAHLEAARPTSSAGVSGQGEAPPSPTPAGASAEEVRPSGAASTRTGGGDDGKDGGA